MVYHRKRLMNPIHQAPARRVGFQVISRYILSIRERTEDVSSVHNRSLGRQVSSLRGIYPLLQFMAARLLSGEREDNADAWIKALSADVVPEKHDTVRKVVHTAIEQRLPILRQLRIVPD